MHFSHSLFFGEQVLHRGQRWSNANHDINLQLKFQFGNVQNHNLYHVEGFWQSSTCCMKHPYDRCGQVSILNNPGMAWEKESHGKRQLERRSLICKLLLLRTCLSAELLESSISSKSHFGGKNTCTLLCSHTHYNCSPWSRGA